MKKTITHDKSSLEKIYDLGITRTLWKSHTLNKINELRKELGLAERSTALPEKTYDKESADQLANMNFSKLGWFNNVIAYTKLTVAGYGLIPVNTVATEEASLLGNDVPESGEHID